MASKFPDKDVNDVLDYQFDWTDFLALGETITAATVTVDPTGELTVASVTNTASAVTFHLSGGVSGTKYTVTCQITTSTANVANRKATITVKDL